MKLPVAALQRAMFATLRADAGLIAFFGGAPRVYDRVPVDPKSGSVTATFPFIDLGEDDGAPDADDCEDGAETFFTVHIWSRAPNAIEARELADLVAQALDADIGPEGHEIVVHEVKGSRSAPGGDGLTTHRTVLARYVTATPLT